MEALAPIFSIIGSAAPALGAISSGVGLAKNIFGGGEKSPATSVAPMPPAAAPNQPGTSPGDYRNQETAYWQQLFAGTGQGLPGGALPPGVQENIDKQASLLGG